MLKLNFRSGYRFQILVSDSITLIRHRFWKIVWAGNARQGMLKAAQPTPTFTHFQRPKLQFDEPQVEKTLSQLGFSKKQIVKGRSDWWRSTFVCSFQEQWSSSFNSWSRKLKGEGSHLKLRREIEEAPEKLFHDPSRKEEDWKSHW